MQVYAPRICIYTTRSSLSLSRQHRRTNGYAGRTASVGSSVCTGRSITQSIETCCSRFAMGTFSLLSVAVVIMASAGAPPVIASPADLIQPETLFNVPQTLSGECRAPKDCVKPKIQRPRSKKAESCTVRCVTTCIRGGEGSPGEGPLNIRRPLVVFKEGFRSRRYCLVECSDICNLMVELGGEP